MNKIIPSLAGLFLAALIACGTTRAQIDSSNNLVTNGNFASGYTGFQSDYQQWMPWWPAAMDAGCVDLSNYYRVLCS